MKVLKLFIVSLAEIKCIIAQQLAFQIISHLILPVILHILQVLLQQLSLASAVYHGCMMVDDVHESEGCY